MFAKCDCLRYLRNALLVALALWGIYWAWYWLAERIMAQSPEAKLAEALGASGALFSGLAFLAATCAFLLQRKSLSAQQNSFDDQRRALWKQSFERSFFNILQIHSEIAQRITKGVQAGLDLDQFCVKLRKIIGVPVPDSGDGSQSLLVNNVMVSYVKAVSEYREKYVELVNESVEVKPLLRSFSALCEMVYTTSDLREDEKQFYFAMIKIRLSWLESFAIIHNCVLDDGWAHIKHMAEKYSIFEGVSRASLTEYAKDKMALSAFGLTSSEKSE